MYDAEDGTLVSSVHGDATLVVNVFVTNGDADAITAAVVTALREVKNDTNDRHCC